MKIKYTHMPVRAGGLIAILAIFCSAFVFQQPVEKLTMKVVTKSLKEGKSFTGEADILFTNDNGGLMMTRTTKPLESYMMINASGELKIYNPRDNTVVLQSNSGISSQASFMYYFLNGSAGDMGLRKAGFQITDTKFDQGLVITTWMPPSVLTGVMGKAELAHENYVPVYMAYYNADGSPSLKVYYSNFTKISNISFPQMVTEFRYRSPKDSVIEKMVYSDLRINDQIDTGLINFRIPEDAKILK